MAPTAIFAVLAVALSAGVNANVAPKITEGFAAFTGEFPYQVSLRANGDHICGGAIVSVRHIVTAAQCVAGWVVPTEVVIGSTSSDHGEVHKPAKMEYHPLYQPNRVTAPFDIAVITLADEITFTEVQNKIDLPTAPPQVGVMGTSSGWGYLGQPFTTVERSLIRIDLQTISRDECLNIFENRIEIHPSQICTSNRVIFGACAGDIGSPLAYRGKLIGIVSYGVACAVELPHVFTSVYDTLPWLMDVLKA